MKSDPKEKKKPGPGKGARPMAVQKIPLEEQVKFLRGELASLRAEHEKFKRGVNELSRHIFRRDIV